MDKLQLYLKGALFQEQEITLPDKKYLVEDPEINFELNCKIREDHVRHQAEIMRVNFIRQIIKCGHDYDIYLVVESERVKKSENIICNEDANV